MEYALNLLVSLLLGYFAGQWIDQKTGKAPVFTLIGLLLGMVLGVAGMYKMALERQQKMNKQKERNKEEGKP